MADNNREKDASDYLGDPLDGDTTSSSRLNSSSGRPAGFFDAPGVASPKPKGARNITRDSASSSRPKTFISKHQSAQHSDPPEVGSDVTSRKHAEQTQGKVSTQIDSSPVNVNSELQKFTMKSKELIEEIKADLHRLDGIQDRFLDRDFLTRARIVHSTTPDFMDKEFIDTFNEYCFLDESIGSKLNLLQDYRFASGHVITRELAETISTFKSLVDQQKSEYLTRRVKFLSDMDDALSEVSSSNPGFIEYLHKLKPTFDFPEISEFKEKLNSVNRRIIEGPLSQHLHGRIPAHDASHNTAGPKNLVPKLTLSERIVNWWDNATSKSKALLVGGVASALLAVGAGGIAAFKYSSESAVQNDSPVSEGALISSNEQRAASNSNVGQVSDETTSTIRATTTTTTRATTTSNVPTTTSTSIEGVSVPVNSVPEELASALPSGGGVNSANHEAVSVPPEPNVPNVDTLEQSPAERMPKGADISITG